MHLIKLLNALTIPLMQSVELPRVLSLRHFDILEIKCELFN